MSVRTKTAVDCRPFAFAGLPTYTRAEVAAWNWFRRYFPGAAGWKLWIQEGWGDLLQVPAGLSVTLTQRHSVDRGEQPCKYSFDQREILIGREAGNHITLATRSAAKRHARLIVDGGQCFLEDLGSPLGTYVKEEKLPPNKRHPLKDGDEFAIFPYLFTVSIAQLWRPQTGIRFYAGAAEPIPWQSFVDASTANRVSVRVSVHPIGADLCLEVSRPFLLELLDRMLRPIVPEGPERVFSSSEIALVEFAILALIERINRDVAFPFQFEVSGFMQKPRFAPESRGLALACSVNLLPVTGAVRVFIPFAALEAMRQLPSPPPETPSAPGVSWSAPVSAGEAEFPMGDIAGLEPGDVLLFKPRLALLLPGTARRFWTLSAPDGTSARGLLVAGNLRALRVDKYCERDILNTGGAETGGTAGLESPDLASLPVRLDIILAEREMTFSELNGLVAGTILELTWESGAPVAIAINGKTIGAGQLVEVEGRLGVKVLDWKGA